MFLGAALLLMPVLVFTYDPGPDTPTVTARPLPAPSAASTTRHPDGVAIIRLEGVGEGFPLRGSVQIYAFVQGDVGGVRFSVEGPTVSFSYVARNAPYLLDPHEPRLGSWDTTFVPNGEYTLTASSVAYPGASRSVRFVVRNP
jgi:hypothetical protein